MKRLKRIVIILMMAVGLFVGIVNLASQKATAAKKCHLVWDSVDKVYGQGKKTSSIPLEVTEDIVFVRLNIKALRPNNYFIKRISLIPDFRESLKKHTTVVSHLD